MEQIRIGKELQSKRGRVCKLYRATYGGSRCYAIVHALSEFTMIFEGSATYAALVKMLRKGWNIVFVRTAKGVPYYELYKRGEASITLTRFIAAQYSKMPLATLDGFFVKPIDDNRLSDNFLDFRQYNVSLPGFDLSGRDDIRIDVLLSPIHETEQYIHITYQKAQTLFTEIVQYEEDLYTMLKTPKYCNHSIRGNERGFVSVNGGDAQCNLSRFVAIYKDYYSPYRGTENSIENFVHDFKKIKKDLTENIEAEHLNGNKHINTFENLMLVDKRLNQKKRDLLNWFVGEYGVHPVLNDAGEIIFAYETLNMGSGRTEKRYYKCRSFQDFVDWIRLYLGKERFAEKLQLRYNPLYEGEQPVILTPGGMIAAGISNQRTANENVVSLEEHICWRDELLALPDEAFKIHEAQERRGLDSTVNLVLDMLGMKLG